MAEAPKRKIFRQAALDRLSSPEQLDRLVIISDPLGWLALTTLLTILALIVAWGIFGEIPEQVKGDGILVSEGGKVLDAMSPSNGRISKLLVRQDAHVDKGQEIAVIEQTTLHQQYLNLQETLKAREAEKAELAANYDRENPIRQKNFTEQIAAQRQILAAAQQRSDYLKLALANREAIADTGALTRDRLEQTRADYNRTLQDISAARVRILEIQSESMQLESSHRKEMNDAGERVAEAQRQVSETKTRLELNGHVLAPAAGRVTELKVFEGEVVEAGTPLASIASVGDTRQAIVYVPTKDGKRVLPGMIVRVSPSTVKKEEYGTIIGTVMEVSEFPATRQGMLAVLQNEGLVNQYAREGAPYAARVNLKTNPATTSGFKWTSGAGPNLAVTSGTTVAAEITVARQPPIDLIIPFIRKHTGIGFLGATDK